MAGIKKTAADTEFSICIREAADWVCQRCGKDCSNERHLMDCSHIITRGNWSTRFTVRNALALCRGCHRHISKAWHEHEPLAEEIHGKGVVDDMRRQAAIPHHGIKRKVSEIAKHYRGQTEYMKTLRADGWRGYIPPKDWED